MTSCAAIGAQLPGKLSMAADFFERFLGRNRNEIDRPRIPSYLLWSAGIGLALTVLFYWGIVHQVWHGTYLETMFAGRGTIPYMTAYLTFFALLQLAGLRLHLSRESRNLAIVASVFHKRPAIDVDTAGETESSIRDRIRPGSRIGLVYHRVRRVLHRVQNNGSSNDVAALLSEQAEIDRAILSSSNATVRFVAWLIPVLGFVGTVMGISLAISAFPAMFENAAAEDDGFLGPITANLGVAFETTLMALIEVAIVHFVLFLVEKRENDLLNTFDEFCLDSLLGMVRGGGVPEAEIPAPYRRLIDVLAKYVENGAGLHTAVEKLEGLLRSSKELQTMQQTLHANLQELTRSTEMIQTVERLNRSVEEMTPVLRELKRRRRMQVKILDELDGENEIGQ